MPLRGNVQRGNNVELSAKKISIMVWALEWKPIVLVFAGWARKEK